MSPRTVVALLQVAVPTLGMATLVTPLLLWVAWSEVLFYGVMVYGACALSGFLACTWLQHRLCDDGPAPVSVGPERD